VAARPIPKLDLLSGRKRLGRYKSQYVHHDFMDGQKIPVKIPEDLVERRRNKIGLALIRVPLPATGYAEIPGAPLCIGF
jgi:hypothetical protein